MIGTCFVAEMLLLRSRQAKSSHHYFASREDKSVLLIQLEAAHCRYGIYFITIEVATIEIFRAYINKYVNATAAMSALCRYLVE